MTFNNNSDVVITFPKIIHQTWKTTEIPEKWKKSPEMWKKFHPDWEYRLWTDEDNRNYIKNNYPQFLSIYDSYSYGIQRADFIRYFILKDFGGLYSDLDLFPIENIERLFNGKNEEVYFVKGNLSSFTNAFMVSKKGASFWDHMINGIINNKRGEWWAFGKHLKVMTSTGPLLLTKQINSFNEIVGLLPKKVFNNHKVGDSFETRKNKDSIICVSEGNSWHSFDSKLYNFVYSNLVFFVLLGILFIITLIVFLFLYMLKSKRCEKIIKNAYKRFKVKCGFTGCEIS